MGLIGSENTLKKSLEVVKSGAESRGRGDGKYRLLLRNWDDIGRRQGGS